MAELSPADIEHIVAQHAPGYVVVPEPDAIPAAPASDATAPDSAPTAARRRIEGAAPADAVIADPLITVRIRPAVEADGPSPPPTRTVIVNTQTRRVEAEQG